MSGAALGLPEEVLAWIEATAGGRVILSDRKPGGARKEAWFIDVERSDGTVSELFLRYDRSDPRLTKDPWTLHREATVYLALQDTEVPVPRVLDVHRVHQAMLSERLVGENWFSRISDPIERESTARDFMTKLAALHHLDPAKLDLPAFPDPTTVADAVSHELDEWDRVLAERGGDLDPALSFSLGWLRRNIPAYEGPVVLVQGDTGPGNFMFADGRVVAVVDWELAHLGDPMEDIAWLSLRATQEIFTDFPTRLAEYEALSGNVIDEKRIHYYQVLAETKLQVMAHQLPRSAERTERAVYGGGDVGNGFIYGVLHRRLWMEALARAASIEETAVEVAPSGERRGHEWVFDAVLAQLRDVVVPRSTDPLVIARSKGIARLVKYLAEIDANGAFHEACELNDLSQLLGHDAPSVMAGREELTASVRSGSLSDDAYLGYLWRRVARETELARSAMGALADRHWPPLR